MVELKQDRSPGQMLQLLSKVRFWVRSQRLSIRALLTCVQAHFTIFFLIAASAFRLYTQP